MLECRRLVCSDAVIMVGDATNDVGALSVVECGVLTIGVGGVLVKGGGRCSMYRFTQTYVGQCG